MTLVLVVILVCAMCYHKRRIKKLIASDLADPEYEIPGEPVPTKKNVEVPFAMSSSPAYSVSSDSQKQSTDAPFILTTSPAYGITMNTQEVPEESNEAPYAIPFAVTSSFIYTASGDHKNISTRVDEVSFSMTSSPAYGLVS